MTNIQNIRNEQASAASGRPCGRGTVFGPLRGDRSGRAYMRVDCKKLSCPRCGPFRAKKYRQAVSKRAEEKKLTRLMTLTLDPAKCSVPDSVAYLRRCFNKFRVSLCRFSERAGYRQISFIAIVELQKSGMAHLHVLISVSLPQDWISQAWQMVGGGRIVDIRSVDVHRIGAYLSKYLTKNLLNSVPAKKKRISTSRDIHLFEKKEPLGWEWTRIAIDSFYSGVPLGTPLIGFRFDDVGVQYFAVPEQKRNTGFWLDLMDWKRRLRRMEGKATR